MTINISPSRGCIAKPLKLVVYAPEGLGKTTLASQCPNPIFLDTESGSYHLDVARFPEIRGWHDIVNAVAWLKENKDDFKTLVIDTVDWAERYLIEDICRRNHKNGIEDFGYGKGYTYLAEEFSKFLRSLESLRDQGMHIIMLAHCAIKKFEQPDSVGAYDRYELKLSKQVAPLLKEWCDALLFGNYFIRIAESESGKKRGVGGRERVFYTTHCASWDAKNRHGLDEKLPFDFASIAHLFGANVSTTASKTESPDALKSFEQLVIGREEIVNAFLIKRGEIQSDQTWRDAKADYIARAIAHPERFLKTVEGKIQEITKE